MKKPLYYPYLKYKNQIEFQPSHFWKLIRRAAKQTGRTIIVKVDKEHNVDWFILRLAGENNKSLSEQVIGFRRPTSYMITMLGCRVLEI
jgi:hypothetical protein